MPPRSVCLNVFTTSLGSGKEKEEIVSVREVESEVVGKKEHVVEERARHDSVQGSLKGRWSRSDVNVIPFRGLSGSSKMFFSSFLFALYWEYHLTHSQMLSLHRYHTTRLSLVPGTLPQSLRPILTSLYRTTWAAASPKTKSTRTMIPEVC